MRSAGGVKFGMADPVVVRPGPLDIPGDLLERYSTSGPRYTSYPTAPQFREDFDEDRILEAWKRSQGGGLAVYVHVPFCRTRCLYCACFTETGHRRETVDLYLRAILREADRLLAVIDASRAVEQLAIGGGTPTFLRPEQMRFLVEGLAARLRFSAEAERSIEIDPRRADDAYLDVLLGLGFNRFSFGVQDLDGRVQRYVARVLSERKLAGLIEHLQKRGAGAVNLDLMYGLPGQSEESFSHTIARIVRLRPSRLALFGYAHVPWISPHQRVLERLGLPGARERARLFGLAYRRLLDAGYVHVGMDHFALPDDELVRALESRTLTRNFMGYTTRRGLDLVGIGASSISSVGGTYTQNGKNIPVYIRKAGGSTWARGLLLGGEDLMRREIILDLFCNFHLDIAAFERRFAVQFAQHFATELVRLAPMEIDGLVRVSRDAVEVTPLGRFFIRNICMCFDQYLRSREAGIRYSATV